MRLNSKIAALPLGNLHLRTRALTKIRKAGITTIGDFLTRTAIGAEGIGRIGPGTWLEIRGARSALSNSITEDGNVNWLTYAQSRRFKILPSRTFPIWSGRKFLKHFPKVAGIAVESRFGSAGLLVFKERFLTALNQRSTLDEVGLRLGVIWERVRKIEIEIILMFRRIILADDYCSCQFRFRPEFLQPVRHLADALRRGRGSVVSRDPKRIVQRIWGVSLGEIAKKRIFLEALGLQLLAEKKGTRPYSKRKKVGSERLRKARTQIRSALMRSAPKHVSLSEIQELLRNTAGNDAPSIPQIRSIMQTMGCVERETTTSGAASPLYFIRRPTDEYHRLLSKAGKPMHIRDIWDAVNRSARVVAPRSPKVVSVELGRDARFVPIASSGFWALVEWPNVETRNITDVAAMLLETAKQPLTDDALFKLIAERRTVGRKSVTVLLNQDKRFRRVAGGLWALAGGTGHLGSAVDR